MRSDQTSMVILAQAQGIPDAVVQETETVVADEGVNAPSNSFPPFEADSFASQLLWLAITFGALYWLMSKIALPRVGSILEVRRDRVASDLAEAQRLKEESEAAIAAYEKELAEARARAQAIAAETRAATAAEAEANRKRLEDELAGKLAQAEQTIAASKQAALSNVREIAVEAAAAIVEKLIGKAPAPAETESAVDAALGR